MKTCGARGSSFLAISRVTMRRGSPSWMAANPMPGASYIASNISSISLRTGASTRVTGSDTRRRRLSGRMMMGRRAIRGDVRIRGERVKCLEFTAN
jgi:hypothetical protein